MLYEYNSFRKNVPFWWLPMGYLKIQNVHKMILYLRFFRGGFLFCVDTLRSRLKTAGVQAGQADRWNRDSRRLRELEAEVRLCASRCPRRMR